MDEHVSYDVDLIVCFICRHVLLLLPFAFISCVWMDHISN